LLKPLQFSEMNVPNLTFFRHPLKWLLLLATALGVGFCIWMGAKLIGLELHRMECRCIYDKIDSLKNRRPSNVGPEEWEVAVDWAINLTANACLFTDREAVQHFEKALDDKMQGEVSLDVFDWIWDQYAQISPTGKRYNENYRSLFHQQLQEARKATGEEKK
jgi:hypothetical protein